MTSLHPTSRRIAARWWRGACLALLTLALAVPVQAAAPQTPVPPADALAAPQGTNLLANPGFEGSASNQTPCDRYDGNGNFLDHISPVEISTPAGWKTYFKYKVDSWSQPEVRTTTKAIDPRRVYAGNQAVMLFTFWRTHDAGFYQQVAVTPGMRYRLTGWVHAWTNNSDDPHVSCCDPWQAWQYLGLDPTGGTNPFAATVVWSSEAHIYDVYAQLPPVEVVAQGSTMTVFLRSWVKWPVKHNDMYWDEIRLMPVRHVYLLLIVPGTSPE